MTARRAAFTEIEIRRAIRAAKAEGARRVEVVSCDGRRIICELEDKPRDEAEPVERWDL